MKVLLYFGNEKTIHQSGIGRALKHQKIALKQNNIEYTLDPNDTYDLAHINIYFKPAKILLKKLIKNKIPFIMHGHSTLEDFANSFRGWKLVYKVWYKPNLLWFYKNSKYIIAPTKYAKDLIINYGFKNTVVDISNGIELNDYKITQKNIDDFKNRFNINNEKVVIGIGWFFNRKGIKDFFEIARKKPNIKFIWFGKLNHMLTQINVLKAIKNRPSNVIMPGYVDGSVIKGAYGYASCMLFPSYEETEGIVVLEALAAKCPLLIRDIGVYKDWLTDGVNCYKANNNDEFCKKIDQIISSDNKEIVENGYKVAEERSLDKIGLKLKNFYNRVLENK